MAKSKKKVVIKRGGKKKSSAKPRVEAYCVKCKEKRIMDEPRATLMANGRDAVRGQCPECGTGMFKIGSMP